MIGYVTLGTSDFDRSVAFYDALLAPIGVRRLWTHGTTAAWGTSREAPALLISAPFDGEAPTVGNGVMVALKVVSRAQVDAVHACALTLGGSDEGAPGPRGSTGFYGGYFRDPDGNKLNAYIPG
ncbi:MAG: catechol 2,3-dioxygenase-like lactoylglutathione lyase family enzyme [Myxococcota bacterium]|jgi:catechol 2,3-dioxygenase-like lactoylglutathione lyase family enzyme